MIYFLIFKIFSLKYSWFTMLLVSVVQIYIFTTEICTGLYIYIGFPSGSVVKNPAALQETWV